MYCQKVKRLRVTEEVIKVNNLYKFMVEVGLLGKRELVERRAYLTMGK